ncbi:MAG: hypothetical protein D3920_16020, partial [Candidatus Electrothrix sp. AW2]|nr:hypothetical protein [Candidatus Electrothrix gigas]
AVKELGRLLCCRRAAELGERGDLDGRELRRASGNGVGRADVQMNPDEQGEKGKKLLKLACKEHSDSQAW